MLSSIYVFIFFILTKPFNLQLSNCADLKKMTFNFFNSFQTAKSSGEALTSSLSQVRFSVGLSIIKSQKLLLIYDRNRQASEKEDLVLNIISSPWDTYRSRVINEIQIVTSLLNISCSRLMSAIHIFTWFFVQAFTGCLSKGVWTVVAFLTNWFNYLISLSITWGVCPQWNKCVQNECNL